MERLELNENEIIEALVRSGYLLESEISKYLSNNRFFIETNIVLKDEFTGKTREIDLVAEYFNRDHKKNYMKCSSKINFVFEIKNNISPLVLLTEFEFSPRVTDWGGIKEFVTIPEGINYNSSDTFYEKITRTNNTRSKIFTQYCSFQGKKNKNEIMAYHPDNLYEGLKKVTQYCEDQVRLDDEYDEIGYVAEKTEGYFRHHIYLPILLIADDLFECEMTDDRSPILKKVERSLLIFNYHYNNEPKMAFVYVVTKKGFPEFIESMIQVQNEVEDEMIQLRSKSKIEQDGK